MLTTLLPSQYEGYALTCTCKYFHNGASNNEPNLSMCHVIKTPSVNYTHVCIWTPLHFWPPTSPSPRALYSLSRSTLGQGGQSASKVLGGMRVTRGSIWQNTMSDNTRTLCTWYDCCIEYWAAHENTELRAQGLVHSPGILDLIFPRNIGPSSFCLNLIPISFSVVSTWTNPSPEFPIWTLRGSEYSSCSSQMHTTTNADRHLMGTRTKQTRNHIFNESTSNQPLSLTGNVHCLLLWAACCFFRIR